MPVDILMPALSPTMEKGNLVQWLKAVGDKVRAGDVLAEIETDKATMEVEAAADGVLARIVVPAGAQDVAVNQLIGAIAGDDEPSDEGVPPATAANVVQPSPVMAADLAAAPQPAGAYAVINGTPASPRANGHDAGRIFASPIARRLMAEAGIKPMTVAGSGPHGRILERDVNAAVAGLRALAEQAAATAQAHARWPTQPVQSEQVQLSAPRTDTATPAHLEPSAAPSPASENDRHIRALFAPGSFTETPHDSMRLTIARRLSEAKRTVPHFYLSADCEIDALLELRRQFNDAAPLRNGDKAYRLSVNDFVIRALALALRQVPEANVTFTETAMLRHESADIGVAVAIPGGLITPVVRRAETKTLATISNEMSDLAARARARRLKPEEYQGGTSSVSNLGMYGVRDFAAIVNPPQASILAVGAGAERIVVRDGKPAVATVMNVTLSVDHRAIDGATGASLLAAFTASIEKPMSMLA